MADDDVDDLGELTTFFKFTMLFFVSRFCRCREAFEFEEFKFSRTGKTNALPVSAGPTVKKRLGSIGRKSSEIPFS